MFKRYLLNSTNLPEYATSPFGLFAEDPAGGAGGGGGGGGQGGGSDKDAFDLAKALSDPKAKKVLEDWAEREVAAGLKAKNKELHDILGKYKIKKDDGTDGGYMDPSEAADAIARIKSGGGKEEIDRALTAQKERHTAELEALKNSINNAEGKAAAETKRRHDLMIKSDLKTALINSNVKTGKMHLHEQYLRNYIKIENDGGQERMIVVDDSGKPRYGSSGLMSVEEFVGEYKVKDGVSEDWNVKGNAGSGTNPNGGTNRGGATTVDQSLPPAERLRQHRRAMAGQK